MKKIINKFKRGFTIVELVVVIAVIAILAAVLIPTLVNVINQAEESNDIVLVNNLNTIVSSYGTVGEIDKVTMSDGTTTVYNVTTALTAADANGYDVSKLTPTSESGDIVYNASTNKFIYYADDFSELAYGDEPSSDDVLIVIDSNLSRVGVAEAQNLTVQYCVYSETNASISTASDITIWLYTASSTTTIDAANANVYHFGSGDYVYVSAVASSSYHLYGTYETVYAVKGHIDTSNGEVKNLYIPSGSKEDVTVDINGSKTTIYTDADGIIFNSKGDTTTYAATNINSTVDTSVINAITEAITEIVTTVSSSYTVNMTEATCDTDGSIVYTDASGATITITLPATGHSYGEYEVTLADDCSYLTLTKTCANCDDTISVNADGVTCETYAPSTENQEMYNITTSNAIDVYSAVYEDVTYSKAVANTDWIYTSKTTLKTYSGSDSEVVIPVGTTQINGTVFKNNTTITSVVIPDSVTKMNASAFSGCSNLATISIGSGLTSIGSSAFANCTSLSSVVIPDSVSTIGDNAFDGCTNLTSITIGSGLISIGSSAFANCTSLGGVLFPAGLTSIGNYAFMKCSSLTSVNIPDGVTTLGTWVFQYCSNLTQVMIGNGITEVLEGAFYYCTSLTSVTLPEGLKTIGTNAFLECKALVSISLPSGITSIGQSAFLGTGYVRNYQDSDNGVYIGTYLICGADVENFTVKDGTTLIASYAFSAYDNTENPDYFTNLKTVTLPDSVKYICSFAFSKSSLESITLGNGVTTIGANAFSECTSLTSITIPSSVTSIGTTAFMNCTALATVTFAENSNLKTISTKAFMGCEALTEIVIPESTNNITINSQTFSGCTSLKKVTISSSVTSIYNNTFKNCGTDLAEGESLEIYFTNGSSWTVNGQTVTVDTTTNYSEYFTSTYLSKNWTKQ